MAIISLSTCGGCAALLLQGRHELAQLIERVEVTYCPMLMDAGEIGEVDIALVDGAVRVKEDEDLLMEARQKSRFLVAWGTCAAFGGIPALANQYELEDLIEESYGDTVDPFSYYFSGGKSGETYRELGAELLRKVRKLDDAVRVDYYLPGCPPQVSLLTETLREFRGEDQDKGPRAVVCTECPRKPSKGVLEGMRLFPNGSSDPKVCFISQGSLCLGVMTKGGCGAPCLKGGLPCWGCRGPSQKAIKDIVDGNYFEELMLNTLVRRSRLSEDKLKPVVRILREKGGSSLSFEHNFVKDTSRLR